MTAPTHTDPNPSDAPAADHFGLESPQIGGLFALFLLAALAIYWPALSGGFFSDDFSNITYNDYIHELSWENVRAVLDPAGAPASFTQNYAPVHMLVHALEWQIFGERVHGYHVVNVVLHAIASTLLVVLFLRAGAARLGAIAGGAFFLLHPANVEAVAWIYQLKTTLALILVLLALLLRDRAPIGAFSIFVGALLTKALAAVALPVAALETWCRRAPLSSPAWRWLGAWSVGVALLAIYGFGAFDSTNAPIPRLDPNPLVEARTIVSIAGRYLVMAATGYGVCAFQEVAVAKSAADPWWLGSLVALLLVGARAIRALVRREQEAVYWGWAAASFLPISQLFPFIQPMADRYLYLILPGLIGAVLLAGRRLGEQRAVAITLAAATVLGLGYFAQLSYQRTLMWRRPEVLLHVDAVERFPDGLLANNYRAERAAAAGDVDAAVAALQKTMARGDIRFRPLVSMPVWKQHHGDPRIQEIIREMARRWIDVAERFEHPGQVELRGFAEAHVLLGQYDEAEALLVRALEVGGKRDAETQTQLEGVRRDRAAAGR
jgi:hypothetical protein